jgi:hypothetical protein
MAPPHRRLAGLTDDLPADEWSAYHAAAREAALLAFGRAYEDGLLGAGLDPSPDGGPTYVVVGGPDDELLVVAGAWPHDRASCGRLVAPRELLTLLLADPDTTAVWCDEDAAACFALTAYRVPVARTEMLLVAARTARLVAETEAGAELAFDEGRVPAREWSRDALDAFVRDRDGDAILIAVSRVPAIALQLRS